jgi:hypothetical protein
VVEGRVKALLMLLACVGLALLARMGHLLVDVTKLRSDRACFRRWSRETSGDTPGYMNGRLRPTTRV